MKKFLGLLILSVVLFSGCGQFLNEQFNLGEILSFKQDGISYAYNKYTETLYVNGNGKHDYDGLDAVKAKLENGQKIKTIYLINLYFSDEFSIQKNQNDYLSDFTNIYFENSTFNSVEIKQIDTTEIVTFTNCYFYDEKNDTTSFNVNNNYLFADCFYQGISFNNYFSNANSISSQYICVINGGNVYFYGTAIPNFDNNDAPWIKYLNRDNSWVYSCIRFSNSITSIGRNAFNVNGANIEISKITFEKLYTGDLDTSDLKTIDSCAFEIDEKSYKDITFEDLRIEDIKIPDSVTAINTHAFANWNQTWKIVLDWATEDPVERILTGLNDCGATIVYNDGNVYEKQ